MATGSVLFSSGCHPVTDNMPIYLDAYPSLIPNQGTTDHNQPELPPLQCFQQKLLASWCRCTDTHQ